MTTPFIESPQNQRLKAAAKLKKTSARKKTSQTLVEGYREIFRANQAGWKFNQLFFCREFFSDKKEEQLIGLLTANGCEPIECSAIAFNKLTYRDTPDGLIATSPLVGQKLNELKLPPRPLLLITEGIEKPGNLGTLLRTADACGVDAVIVCDPKTDINNPNAIRASIGTLFYMLIAISSATEVVAWLSDKNIESFAALPDANKTYTAADFSKGSAIVVGAEDSGLSPIWETKASHQINIPMLGHNDSLNVSTAAAVLLYEAVRQRSGP